MDSVINIGLWSSYILVVGCAVLAIVMPLIKAFDDPKVLMKGGMGTGALAVIFLIGWAIADGTAQGAASEGVSKVVGGALITFYILTFVAVAGIVYTEISKIIK